MAEIVLTEDPDEAPVPAPRVEEERAPLRAGERIGHYVVDHYCGHGSFGRTYWAHDTHRPLRVVLKEVRRDSPHALAVSRAEREALASVVGEAQITATSSWGGVARSTTPRGSPTATAFGSPCRSADR